MGLLERFRTAATFEWRPPALGSCRCETHVEDLLGERIPLADGSGAVSVAQLVSDGALCAVPTPDALWLDGLLPNERRGPFHWRVVHQQALAPFLDDEAPACLDDLLFVQPDIDTVLWLEHRTVLAIGAPALCARGVQGALVNALLNPRLRVGP